MAYSSYTEYGSHPSCSRFYWLCYAVLLTFLYFGGKSRPPTSLGLHHAVTTPPSAVTATVSSHLRLAAPRRLTSVDVSPHSTVHSRRSAEGPQLVRTVPIPDCRLCIVLLATACLVYVRRHCTRHRQFLAFRGPRSPLCALFASTSRKTDAAATTGQPAVWKTEKDHLAKVVVVVTLALLAAGLVLVVKGLDAASEFLAAYLIEYSLSIDNLFVFLLIFKYFKCEPQNQERVLNFGLLTAAVLRFAFLFLGEEILSAFAPAILIFGAILLYSSYSILFGKDEDDEDEDLSDNRIVKFVKSFLTVSPNYDGNRFFTKMDGKTVATPLLLVLAVVELSDIVFATDSVPAVLGTTQDLALAYGSNVFAILGLRSLYFLVADSLDQLKYVEPAIGAVLGFIGLKIVVQFLGTDVSTPLSLLVVAGLLGAGVLLSLVDPWKEKN